MAAAVSAGRAAPPIVGRAAPLVVGLAAFLVFAGTLGHGFVFDDNFQVLDNPWVWSVRHLPDLLFKPVWAFMGENASNFYRPVQTLVHLCAASLFGRRPFGFHLLSVLMHTLASLAAFGLARRLTAPGTALLAALLFAVWPIHAEPVAWISAGPDVNAALFLFLCLARWEAWRAVGAATPPGAARRDAAPRRRDLWIASGFYLLALLSKETAIVGPLLGLALWAGPGPIAGATPGMRGSGKTRAAGRERAVSFANAFGIVFALPLIVYLTARFFAFGQLRPFAGRPGMSALQGAATGLMLVPRYVRLAFVPIGTAPDRVVDPAHGLLQPEPLLGAALIAGALVAWVCWRRLSRAAAFAVALLILPLLPALQVRYFTGSLQSDRYLYIPSLGACLLIAQGAGALLARATGKTPRALLAASGALLVLAAGARAAAVASMWRDSATLGRAGIRLEPRTVIMRLELIHGLDEAGRTEEALDVARETARLAPDDRRVLAAVAGLEARSLGDRGEDAIDVYRRALAADPRQPHLWVGLSVALLRAGRPQEAMAAAQSALDQQPYNRAALVNLGTAQGEIGDYAGQERQARALLAIDPRSAPGLMNLGAARLGQNDLEGAREALLQAAALDPTLARVELYLSWIATRRGDQDEAVRRARRASELDDHDAEIWNRLGVALATSGDREGARLAWEKALAARPDDPQARRNLDRLDGKP